MIEKNEPELIEDSFLNSFNNNIIPIQDKQDKVIDEHNISNKKIKKQKEYLNKKNKMFFNELEKLYTTNILLKNKLNEVLNEKKRLNQLIIKMEQQIKLSKKINSENNKNSPLENGDKKDKMSKIELYRKKKRKRRKKNEIKNIYNCAFSNCGKSYPSKGSLNMHIKLKHQNEQFYNFDKGLIKD
jgi:hypothetical protein